MASKEWISFQLLFKKREFVICFNLAADIINRRLATFLSDVDNVIKIQINKFAIISKKLLVSKTITKIIYKIFGIKPLSYLLYLSVDKNTFNSLKPSCLCISRHLFNKDIGELKKNAKNINWIN